MAKAELQAFMERHSVTVSAVFVPWSRSRNKDEKDERGNPRRSLNWRITIAKGGREILTTDYSAGVGHCPSYNLAAARFPEGQRQKNEVIAAECEAGYKQHVYSFGMSSRKREPILPDACDVLASLSMDSSVLDASGFEEWARDLGYDTDSRKAEAIYRACLDIALKLRNGLGESALAELVEAAQDY